MKIFSLMGYVLMLGTLGMAAQEGASRVDDEATLARVAREAARAYRESLPDGSPYLVQAANLERLAGNPDRAREMLRDASHRARRARGIGLPNAPDVLIYKADGFLLHAIGQFQVMGGFREDAVESLRLAIDGDIPGESPFFRLGFLNRVARELQYLRADDELSDVADEAIEVFRRIPANDESLSSVLPSLASILVAAGRGEKAFELLDSIKPAEGEHHDISTVVGSILSHMAYSAAWLPAEQGRETLARIRARVDSLDRADARRPGLTGLVSAYIQREEVENALACARGIVFDGKLPTHGDFGEARGMALVGIGLCQARRDRVEQARTTLREALESLKTIKWGQNREKRIVQVGTYLIRLRDVEGARRCVAELSEGRRAMLLALVGRLLRQQGETEAARTAFEDALKDVEARRLGADEGPDAVPLNDQCSLELAKVRALMGEYDEARRIAVSLGHEDARARAIGEVARIQAEAGQAAAALGWLRDLKEPPVDRFQIYEPLIRGILAYRDRDRMVVEP